MKKLIVIIFLFCIVLLFVNASHEEMRIRVIANSDSTCDQEQKIKVVEKLKEILKTKDYTLEDIQKSVQEIVPNYTIQVTIEKQKFNTRYIDNEVVSGGTYKTLVVRIGSAKGKNYWSVLYPEYFNVSFEEVNSGDVQFKSWLYDTFFG